MINKHTVSRLMFNRFRNHQHHPQGLIARPSADWIQQHSGLPWLELNIQVPVHTIWSEIQAIMPLVVAHREEYSEHQGWESFCIHGRAYNMTREDEHYHSDLPYHWTQEACNLMPNTVKYFQTAWPGSVFRRIRVMRLAAGGYISIHSDSDRPGLGPINIAITQPTHCAFVMENFGTVPFQPGRAVWLDVSNRHTVFNDSDQDRWHIIVHQESDDIRFQNIVANSYDMLYNQLNEIMPHNCS